MWCGYGVCRGLSAVDWKATKRNLKTKLQEENERNERAEKERGTDERRKG